MGTVSYTLLSGELPITVELVGSGLDANVHAVFESGLFNNVPAGNYQLRFTDSQNCIGTEDIVWETTSTTTQLPVSTTSTTTNESSEPLYTGTGYYFSETGSDSNDGLTNSSPKQTLTAANNLTLTPGDAILFKRGESWEGELALSYSGTSTDRIVIGAYGAGNKPKIYGSRVLNASWSVYSGNIYVCDTALDIGQVFLNGERCDVSRYPNNDYHFISSFSGTTINSSTIDNGVDHTGAKVIFRDGYYQTSLRTVTSYGGSTSFVINSTTDSGLEVNDGFMFMGKLGYLTEPNQWFHDTVNNKLYVRTPDNTSPANYEVRVAVDERGMYANARNYFTIDGIEFLQQKLFGSVFVSCDDYTIENCTYLNQEEVGHKQDSGNDNVIIRNNHFEGQSGLGLYTYHSINLLVEGNTFTNIGLYENIGLNGVGEKSSWGSGSETSQPWPDPPTLSSDNITFRYNRFINMGYNGMFWRGPALVERNFCKDICLWKQDGQVFIPILRGVVLQSEKILL
jgi:hypothetical protein